MKNKIVTIIIISLICLMLSGCGKNEAEPGKSENVSVDKKNASTESLTTDDSVKNSSDEETDVALPTEETSNVEKQETSDFSFCKGELDFIKNDKKFDIYSDGMFSYSFDPKSGYLCVIKPDSETELPGAAADNEGMIKMISDYIGRIYPELDLNAGEWDVSDNETYFGVTYSLGSGDYMVPVLYFMFDENRIMRAANLFIDGISELEKADYNISESEALVIADKAVREYIDNEIVSGIVYYPKDFNKLVPEINLKTFQGDVYWSIIFMNDNADEPTYFCDVSAEDGNVKSISKSK